MTKHPDDDYRLRAGWHQVWAEWITYVRGLGRPTDDLYLDPVKKKF